jgi:hypothetical protein
VGLLEGKEIELKINVTGVGRRAIFSGLAARRRGRAVLGDQAMSGRVCSFSCGNGFLQEIACFFQLAQILERPRQVGLQCGDGGRPEGKVFSSEASAHGSLQGSHSVLAPADGLTVEEAVYAVAGQAAVQPTDEVLVFAAVG